MRPALRCRRSGWRRSPYWRPRPAALDLAPRWWQLCAAAGFDFLSLGAVPVEDGAAALAAIDCLPELIRRTENVFAGVLVRSLEHAAAFDALRRTARAVREIATTTPRGFGNLRLAMLAGVEPLCPFFRRPITTAARRLSPWPPMRPTWRLRRFAGAASLADARQH